MAASKLTVFDHAIVQAARVAVTATEPAELELLEDMLDPPRKLFRWPGGDAVGFGAADLVHWASPYAIAAAIWYGRIWYDEGKSVVESRTRKLVSKLLAGKKTAEVEPPRRPEGVQLTPEQQRAHIAIVKRYVVVLGMDEAQAELLARAIVGSLITGAGEDE